MLPIPPHELKTMAKFFSSKYFAVIGYSSINVSFANSIGASPKPNKSGNHALKWYINHKLPVFPMRLNPFDHKDEIIEGLPVIQLLDLKEPSETSLSVVRCAKTKLTPLLQDAAWMGVKRVWLEPGVWARPNKTNDKRSRAIWKEIQELGFEVVISNRRCIYNVGRIGIEAYKKAEARGEFKGLGEEQLVPQSEAMVDSQAEGEMETVSQSKMEKKEAETNLETDVDSIAEPKL